MVFISITSVSVSGWQHSQLFLWHPPTSEGKLEPPLPCPAQSQHCLRPAEIRHHGVRVSVPTITTLLHDACRITYKHPHAGKVKRPEEERAVVRDEVAWRIGYVVMKLRLKLALAVNVETVAGNCTCFFYSEHSSTF